MVGMLDKGSPLWRTVMSPAVWMLVASGGTAMLSACTSRGEIADTQQGSDLGGATRDTGNDGGAEDAGEGDEISFEDSGTEDGSAEDEGVSEEEGDSADPRFDLGTPVDQPPMGEGCKKVDFLFVVDNSGSMVDEQARLIAAFPDFMARIEATIEADDYHIMATDTDAAAAVFMCNAGVCQCGPDKRCCGQLCTDPEIISCNGEWCTNIEPAGCEVEWGAGSIHRAGDLDQPCELATANRYIDNDEPNIVDKFSCIAEVGTNGGGDEQPVFAMLTALGPDSNQAGACNEGFLRDDAILVVVMITDEDDLTTAGNPQEWRDQLVALKGGDPDAVVVVGFVSDSDLANGTCTEDEAKPAPRLREFLGLFGEQGVTASICQQDFGPDFQRSVDWIDKACDIFDPPE